MTYTGSKHYFNHCTTEKRQIRFTEFLAESIESLALPHLLSLESRRLFGYAHFRCKWKFTCGYAVASQLGEDKILAAVLHSTAWPQKQHLRDYYQARPEVVIIWAQFQLLLILKGYTCARLSVWRKYFVAGVLGTVLWNPSKSPGQK